MNSRAKGARIERGAAAFLRTLGFVNADRAARSGKAGGEDITRDAIPGLWLEVKGVEKLNVEEALHQAEAAVPAHERPLLLHKRNRTAWCATIRAAHLEVVALCVLRALGYHVTRDYVSESAP